MLCLSHTTRFHLSLIRHENSYHTYTIYQYRLPYYQSDDVTIWIRHSLNTSSNSVLDLSVTIAIRALRWLREWTGASIHLNTCAAILSREVPWANTVLRNLTSCCFEPDSSTEKSRIYTCEKKTMTAFSCFAISEFSWKTIILFYLTFLVHDESLWVLSTVSGWPTQSETPVTMVVLLSKPLTVVI